MSFKKLVVRNFTGGIGTAGEKNDVPNSYRFAKNINPFEDPSYLLSRLFLHGLRTVLLGLRIGISMIRGVKYTKRLVEDLGPLSERYPIPLVRDLRYLTTIYTMP
jgi:hypothetical protein